MNNWIDGFIDLVRTINDILTAGIAITAFSLLLYALTFNLKDRVARSFAMILICVVIVFTAESLGGIAVDINNIEFWYKLQWLGIVLLPPTYLHFSDALVATTGRPSRWKRRWAVRLSYLFSLFLLFLIPSDILVGPINVDQISTPHLDRTLFTELFTVYYWIIMFLSWINFFRAYIRTVTPISRRRMGYLVVGALAPAIGSFPFLLFGSGLADQLQGAFWIIATVSNAIFYFLIILMAYSVAFFGVAWSDRMVKTRLFKWILRGPVTASIALGMTTLIRRSGAVFGYDFEVFVPIVMVTTIVVFQHLITLFAPIGEKWFFYGNDQQDLEILEILENRLLTRNDLLEFFDMILSALMDRLQSNGSFVVSINDDGLELVLTNGKINFKNQDISEELSKIVIENGDFPEIFQWNNNTLFPLYARPNGDPLKKQLIGLLGLAGIDINDLDEEQQIDLKVMIERAGLALSDRRLQFEIFDSMEKLSKRVNSIQQLRARGRYDRDGVFMIEDPIQSSDLPGWVKDALTHFWGGPKFSDNPLLELKVVEETAESTEGNKANALRAILRNAINQVKPEGERRFTAEWILYNILEMKFLEGRKVREIALKLSMSEADLYRKQRVAIEAVANKILEMEKDSRNGSRNTD
ncbi:MAG TPA: histidine kinase N-terminal 7TM domain-containing protein [Anaerolineaceae bacterium]|nr:histidine kinase N-terminal 7TM domain-containing protein [Anaerolineaceae bacterium]